MHFRIFLYLTCLLSFTTLRASEWYSEYWQKLLWKMWSNDSLAINTYVRMETGNHLKGFKFFQISEQLVGKVSDNLTLEFHYSYIHSRNVVKNSPWRWDHRLEFEINPSFPLPCNWKIKTRNRLEIRKIQKEKELSYRLRQLTMLVVPIKEGGRFKAFSIYNELFFETETHRINQDRFCPCQFTFSVTDKIDMDLYLMFRFHLIEEIWRKTVIVGTQFSF